MPERITDRLVKALSPPAKDQRIVYDDKVVGFGVRITATGSKAFVLRYVFPKGRGREYRYTIGSPGVLSVEAARRTAAQWQARIELGETHPLAERRKRIEEAERAKAEMAKGAESTFRAVVEDYIRREQRGRRRNATADQVERGLLVDCSPWHERAVDSIAAEDVQTLLDEILHGDPSPKCPRRPRPYTANRTYAYLKTFFAWCARPGIGKIGASPMIDMPRPFDGEAARSRYFTDHELKALWKGADQLGGSAGTYLKVALLTGKRRSVLAAMQWDEINANGLWTPPIDARRRKRNKRVHPVPLPQLALRVVEPLKPPGDAAYRSPFVFPGRERGTHLHPGSTLQTKVRETSELGDFIMHACRHTVETRMAELRVPPHVRDLVLDHAPARGAGGGYDHYDYADEIRDALERWAAHIQGLVAPKEVKALR